MEEVKTICGFPIEELILFADACRKQGITTEELHWFIGNVENAYNYAIDEVKKQNQKAIERCLSRFKENTE